MMSTKLRGALHAGTMGRARLPSAGGRARDSDCVILMNRAHDRVLVPPPARHALAAFALAGQGFGVTRDDLALVRSAAEEASSAATREALGGPAERLEAVLPPAGP